MTTIFKVSDQESITPVFAIVERKMVAPTTGRALSASLDDAGLADEMDCIEKCASSGENYAYSTEWSTEQIAQIREYAVVCGMKGKMLPVRQAAPDPQPVQDDPEMKRLSDAAAVSKPAVSAELSLAVGDPFHLASASDAPVKKDKWEKVTPESKLAAQPSANARTGSIMPLRGEYDYETSPSLRVRRGENSVADPDAIGKLAKETDSGERLKTENAQHAVERKAAKTAWQGELVQAAKASGVGSIPRGKVFMIGSLPEATPNSGLDFKQAVEELNKIQAPTLPDIPDMTDGEQLKAANTTRKTGIQRRAEEDDWQRVKGTTKPSLTDEFADALEHQLSARGVAIKV